MFLLSGAAALIYEVLWVRHLSLIFGGSHLAVTTVLSVFMAGLALGSYLIGKRVTKFTKLLRLYGTLELGVAFSALVFVLLLKLYPPVYIALAGAAPMSPLYLSFIRVTFAVIALIVPTTLMGGTLPVLSGFISRRAKGLGSHLSFLYGVNTLGAVVGTMAAGFFLLRFFGTRTTMVIAVAINVTVGLLAVLLQNRAEAVLEDGSAESEPGRNARSEAATPSANVQYLFSLKLVLWGIGVSGFCALGYEVLWTRILSIVVGASVYGFTTMLVAFLLGIALGSAAYGLFLKLSALVRRDGSRSPLISVVGFGIVQVIIGVAALLVSLYIRDLPANSVFLQNYFSGLGMGLFGARQWASFTLAFSYMVVPAFFMGLAFPLAGKVHAEYRNVVGRAVGEVLAFNTVGAILGAAITGFAFVYLLGIQTSLQILTIINIGFGLLVIASVKNKKALNLGTAAAVAAVLLFVTIHPGIWRMWDTNYFAVYRTNDPGAFRTPEMIREAIEQTDVLYYAEGIQAIVSSIRVKGGYQAFLTNGRVEASTHNEGLQCQYTLGHLPMLLNKDPRKVFVLGTGSGMTLGATSVHPSVEEITLAEIEPKVIGVARTFSEYNHNAVDNPKVKIVFNDGRNFLMTTKEKFDVITADPIHPWFSGAGYLYTTEYFRLAAEHLNPGGVACQWLPVYELTTDDLRSILSTFSENFRYVMVWLTHDDAELVGSNAPILIDEEELQGRISSTPEVLSDLQRVKMGSAEDLLSYFVMGTEGAKAFSRGGTVNTDENLYLEFSAPLSVGKASLMEQNVRHIARYREGILPYLQKPPDETRRAEQKRRWQENGEAARMANQAQGLFLSVKYFGPEFQSLMAELDRKYPGFAPWRFLKNEYEEVLEQQPRLLLRKTFPFLNAAGVRTVAEVSAVRVRISNVRAVVMFVDNRRKAMFGQLYISGQGRDEIDNYLSSFTKDVLGGVEAVYYEEAKAALIKGSSLPPEESALARMKDIISRKVAKKEVVLNRPEAGSF